jgi:hypothetical protein
VIIEFVWNVLCQVVAGMQNANSIRKDGWAASVGCKERMDRPSRPDHDDVRAFSCLQTPVRSSYHAVVLAVYLEDVLTPVRSRIRKVDSSVTVAVIGHWGSTKYRTKSRKIQAIDSDNVLPSQNFGSFDSSVFVMLD